MARIQLSRSIGEAHPFRRQWPGTPLASALGKVAGAIPDVEAVRDDVNRLNWRELDAMARQMAANLTLAGVGEGSPVVVQLPNWVEGIAAAYACWLLRAVYVPVVPIYREAELAHVLHDCEPTACVTPHVYRSHDHAQMFDRLLRDEGFTATTLLVVRPDGDLPGSATWALSTEADSTGYEPQADPDAIAAVLYTSGTTGKPKGVTHSHNTLAYEVDSIASLLDICSGDRAYMASPLTHVTGLLYATILPVRFWIPVSLQDRWDPRTAVERIVEDQCTFTVSATPFLRGLCDEARSGNRPDPLRAFICGGADIPPELVAEATTLLDAAVVRTYGSTECPTVTAGDPFGDPMTWPDDDGLPIGEAAFKLSGSAPSELLVKGPELFLGYTNAEDNERAFTDGWFRTGDTAEVTDDGRLRITGRLKDIINRGGEKFSAREVEDCLRGMPGLADVAVVAVPDPRLVERACAFVVLDTQTPSAPQLDAIAAWVRQNGLAIQKAPEHIRVVEELPTTPSGKVRKNVLRDRFLAESE